MAAPDQQASAQTPRRQYVNFAFYKLDPAWRRLPEDERAKGKQEFIRAIEDYAGKVLVIPYSTVGIRGDCDIMLWRISYELELFQQMTAKMLASGLGKYLTTPYSYLSMTKRSIYVDHHTHEGQESKRLTVVPGKAKYIFVYPFLKTREWFLLTKAARQGMMDEHIEVGHRFPSVKLNTTYSFGLDDQEWVVAFESDKPEDFLDLVMALRETEGSRYTLRDTPIFTCIRGSLKEALDTLGGQVCACFARQDVQHPRNEGPSVRRSKALRFSSWLIQWTCAPLSLHSSSPAWDRSCNTVTDKPLRPPSAR